MTQANTDILTSKPTHARKQYPSYKPSGVEWLGDIPAHWAVRRLKSVIDAVVNGAWGSEPQSNEDDLVCVRVADFDYERLIISSAKLTLRNLVKFEQNGKLLSNGDLLLEKSGGGEIWPVGRAVNYTLSEKAVSSNFIAKLVASSAAHKRFLCYVLASMYAVALNTRSIKQTTGIQNLDAYSYLCERYGFPPLPEQHSIAAFLDRETSEIQTLITKKQRLIGLLQEKRAALISHAVTHGIDPSVPLKPSGVEWLDEIPAHWAVLQLKRLLAAIQTGWTPNSEQRLADEGEWAVLKVGCVRNGEFFQQEHKVLAAGVEPNPSIEVHAGDLLMSRANTTELVGSVGLIKETRPHLTLSDKTFRLIPNGKAMPSYLNYLLQAKVARDQIEYSASGASPSMQNISQDTVRTLLLPLPPLSEQAAIILDLDHTTARVGVLCSKIRQHVTKLQEYRTALISAAVTGKIDVRSQSE